MSQEKSKTPQPFAKTVYNENTCTQKLIEWMKKVSVEKNLGFGDILFDTSSDLDGDRPDAVIFSQPQSHKILCLIEFKRPSIDHTNLKIAEKARREAKHRHSPYFATSNFKELVWFDSESGREIDWFTLSRIETLELIEDVNYKGQITAGIEKFLCKLYEVHIGKAAVPKRSLDELFRYYLHQKVEVLADIYWPIVRDRVHKDKVFNRNLKKWFEVQCWDRSDDPEKDYQKIARQAAYLLINKIIFYNALQSQNPAAFNKLEIPESLTKGGLLQGHLQNYFNYVLQIDYKTIYTMDFIDEQIAFPDHTGAVEAIKDLVKFLDKYDFTKVGVDIIGRIFEGMIPSTERHNLGQFFTNPDIVDLILKFCMKHETDKVFDPSCGTGTFLVRAYQHKKLMNPRLSHNEILDTIWGTDIAKFPAHLATINLAINDLSVKENYPNILQEDFFSLKVGGRYEDNAKILRKREKSGLNESGIKISYPAIVDCVVGNPPYTRQEEIPSTGVSKKDLTGDTVLSPSYEFKQANLSRRAGIHAYFFVHGFKFLRNGGRFGFVVSNSWLDVDYGKGLQEFFLKNAKIVAIIESKVERWFADADVNTCIIILEKAEGEKLENERNNHIVRFIQFNKKLAEYNIPLISDIWEKQKARLDAIDGLVKAVLGPHGEYYENKDMRILLKKQSDLWEEGYDKTSDCYAGAKWGKYVRAPQIFFRIMEKCRDKLAPLKEIANVRFGMKTGVNEFFYLTEEEVKKRDIEKEFWMHKEDAVWAPNYVVKSPDEIKTGTIVPSALKFRLLLVRKDKQALKGKNVLRYIAYGEKKKFNKRPTCDSRGDRWYDIGTEISDIIAFPERISKRFAVFMNPRAVFLNKNLYGIDPKNKSLSKVLSVALNSTITLLWLELLSRQPGGGGGPLDIDVNVTQNIPFLKENNLIEHKNKLDNIQLLDREIEDIFAELGADMPEEIAFDKIKPDRRELDAIVMGDILGLSDEEQMEVYKAVVDLVRTRLDKAKSLGTKDKTINGLNRQKALEELRSEMDFNEAAK